MTDAILTVLKSVRDASGDEPTQEEIANALKSYFILFMQIIESGYFHYFIIIEYFRLNI